MGLEISQREREGIQILDLRGRITAGEETAAFREAIESLEPGARVVLNMQHVEYVDSTGLGALVMCANRLKKAEGAARLVHVNRRNIELLVMTKIDTMFEVFTEEIDAVNSFFPDRQIKRFDILSFVQQLKDE